jgi:uncharacterized protein (DUF1015 family)
MASVRPFPALRPVPEVAADVASVPYDVISVEEARALAAGNPRSFLHVIRPEIDLPEGTDEHADAVYEKGAQNLRALEASADTVREDQPALYVYRLTMDGRQQTGVVGTVAVAEYDDGTILKHERTRPDKEDDRTRHLLTQSAHAEPVMLTYRGTDAIDQVVERTVAGTPLYDFTAPDGVRHEIWKADDASALSDAFDRVPKLYVADGHHRCAAASRAAKETSGEEAQHFLAVLFPMEQMAILPYNRAIKRLPNGPEAFLSTLREMGDVTPTDRPTPDAPGQVCLFLRPAAGEEPRWFRLELPAAKGDGASDQLDVARLQDGVLEPLLGIENPRTDQNIAFVGGIRGTEELERLVREGKADLTISMFATSPEELLDVSDAGELMPPKSTWFEPKLRSGLLVHTF